MPSKDFIFESTLSLKLNVILSTASFLMAMIAIIILYIHFAKHKMHRNILSNIVYINLICCMVIDGHNGIISNNSLFPFINDKYINYIEGIYCKKFISIYLATISHIHHGTVCAFILTRTRYFFKPTPIEFAWSSYIICMVIGVLLGILSSMSIINLTTDFEPTIFYANDNYQYKKCDMPHLSTSYNLSILCIVIIANCIGLGALYNFWSKMKQILYDPNNTIQILSQYYDPTNHDFAASSHTMLIYKSFYSGIFLFLWNFISHFIRIYYEIKVVFALDSMIRTIFILLAFDIKRCNCNHNIIDNDHNLRQQQERTQYLQRIMEAYYDEPLSRNPIIIQTM